MFSKVSMSVSLPTDNVLFYGNPQQARPQVFYGTIELHVRKSIIPKSLYVKVTGESLPGKKQALYYSQLAENNSTNINIDHKVFLSHKEVIFEHTDKEIALKPGTYEFDFCIKFDPSLPETIHTEYGIINYQIKAVLVKANIGTKIKKTVPIYLRRLTNFSDGAISLPKSIEITKKVANLVWVKLSSLTNCYSKGQVAEINVNLEPIPKNLKIRSIGVAIVEYLLVTDPDNAESQQNQTKVIKSIEIPIDSLPLPPPLPSSSSSSFASPSSSISTAAETDSPSSTSNVTAATHSNPTLSSFPSLRSYTFHGSAVNAVLNSIVASNGASTASSTSSSAANSTPNSDSESELPTSPRSIVAHSKLHDGFSYKLSIEIPKSSTLLQHDLCNTMFQVHHKLRFYCTVENAENTKILSLLIPFYIVPEAYFSNLFNLPPYPASELLVTDTNTTTNDISVSSISNSNNSPPSFAESQALNSLT